MFLVYLFCVQSRRNRGRCHSHPFLGNRRRSYRKRGRWCFRQRNKAQRSVPAQTSGLRVGSFTRGFWLVIQGSLFLKNIYQHQYLKVFTVQFTFGSGGLGGATGLPCGVDLLRSRPHVATFMFIWFGLGKFLTSCLKIFLCRCSFGRFDIIGFKNLICKKTTHKKRLQVDKFSSNLCKQKTLWFELQRHSMSKVVNELLELQKLHCTQ